MSLSEKVYTRIVYYSLCSFEFLLSISNRMSQEKIREEIIGELWHGLQCSKYVIKFPVEKNHRVGF